MARSPVPSPLPRPSATTAAAAAGPVDVFDARPTHRLGKNQNAIIEADGDTWQELLAVCDVGGTDVSSSPSSTRNSNSNSNNNSNSNLVIRSYFENRRSGKRVWDEPPSGASNVIAATDEMRKMATLQLNELHVVTGAVPGMDSGGSSNNSNGSNGSNNNISINNNNNKTTKSLGSRLAGAFRRGKGEKTANNNDDDKKQQQQQQRKVVQYKPGSKLKAKAASASATTPTSRRNGGRGDASDPHLQEAIARSIAKSQGIPYSATMITSTMTASMDDVDDDDLEMAKALSLSTAAASGTASTTAPATAYSAWDDDDDDESEEAVLRRVLEASKLETNHTAAVPGEHRQRQPGSSWVSPSPPQDKQRPVLNLKMAPPPPQDAWSQQDISDRKMPAVPTTPPHAHSRVAAAPASPSSTPHVGVFDPYSVDHCPSPNSYEEQERKQRMLREASSSAGPPRKMDDIPQRPASPRGAGAAAAVARRALRRPGSQRKLQDKAGLV